MTQESQAFSPGLEGVIACATRLSHVDGAAGKLIFNGYNAIQLAEQKTVEDVWFLLREGHLPNRSELSFFKDKVAELSFLSPSEIALVRAVPRREPMAAFRSAISMIACSRGYKPWLNRDLAVVGEEVLALCSVAPSVVEIIRTGKVPKRKDEGTGYAERYLWGVLGHKPEADQVAAVQTYLILTMDHGLNASTFSARVTASTGADVGAALTTAIGTLSGPLHGGAPGPVLDMLDSIGDVANVETWLAGELAAKRRIMGFGHRVYRTDDPRAICLRGVAERQKGPRIELARAAEQAILAALKAHQDKKASEGKPVRPLRTNVEFWTAVVLEHVGIPRELFSSTFCTSRIIGWGEHVREHIKDNKLIRPLSLYNGPPVTDLTADLS